MALPRPNGRILQLNGAKDHMVQTIAGVSDMSAIF